MEEESVLHAGAVGWLWGEGLESVHASPPEPGGVHAEKEEEQETHAPAEGSVFPLAGADDMGGQRGGLHIYTYT